MRKTIGIVCLSLLLLIPRMGLAAVTVEKVFSGLGVPWGMAFLPSGELLVTERAGRLSRIDLERGKQQSISGLPEVYAAGQGGLLDIVLSPTFSKDGLVYITYSKPLQGSAVTTLGRAQVSGNRLVDWKDLLVTRSQSNTTRHFGSRIAFDDDGHVFFSVGDRGVRPNGQDLQTHAGSILRLNLDGSVPLDNPFVGQANALPEIWSYGHRNPQGLSFDSATGELWAIEHGPRGGDEINLIEKGKNYGWPVISYGKEYWGPMAVGEGTHRAGMEQPVKYYVPSIAPGSLLMMRSKHYPQWQGKLLAGALKLQHLNIIALDGKRAISEQRLFESLGERIRAITLDPAGQLYFSTDRGNIYRVKSN